MDVAKHHDPERHLLDLTRDVRQPDDITDPELILEQNKKAAEDIADKGLRAEGDS